MPSRALNVVITGDPRPFQKALGGAGGSLDAFGAKQKTTAARLNGAGKAMTRGLTVPLLAIGASAVKVAADFEQQMSNVAAVTDAPKKAMGELRDAAINAGAKTIYSAKEAALAETELAKGGVSAADILGGALKGALGLASAGQLDLGEAAAITANALNLFGMRGSEATHVADAMATAANATTADVDDFGMALQQSGSVAKSAGLSFNQTMTALEALAANGIKGSDAGTSLKTALIQLLKPTKKQAELADDLNLKFTDQQGNMKSLGAISAMLRGRLGNMTSAQRTATLATLAGTDGVRTLTSLYDAGPAKLAKYEQGLRKQGTAADVAAKKQDNLKGKLEQARGSVETLGIIIGSALIPPLANLVQHATGAANTVAHAFSSLDPASQQLVLVGAGIVAALGPVLSIAGRVAEGFTALRGGISVLGAVFTPLRVALIVAGVAFAVLGGHVTGAGGAFETVQGVLSSVGGVLRSLVGIVQGIIGPIASLVNAFAQSSAGAAVLRGAIVALIGAGLGILAARMIALVGPALTVVRALFSVAGAATALGLGLGALRAAVIANPLTALLGVLGFVAGAMGLFNSKTQESRVTQQAYADAILQTRDALDRLKDAQGGVKDADLAAKEAALNLAQAEKNRNDVYKNSKSSSLDKREADLQVARAERENEKATTGAARAHRDLGANQRKSLADANASIATIKKHRDQLKGDIDGLEKLGAKFGITGKLSGLLAQKQKELNATEKDLKSETARLGSSMAATGKGIAGNMGAAMGSVRSSINSAIGKMQGLGNVRVNMSGFAASIQAGLSSAMSAVDSAVASIRSKLANAAPHKRNSPSPNEVIAEGFKQQVAVVSTGYANVITEVTKGAAAFKAAATLDGDAHPLFITDADIRVTQQELQSLQDAFDYADRQHDINAAKSAQTRAQHAVAAAKKAQRNLSRRHGEKADHYKDRRNDAADRVKNAQGGLKDARSTLQGLIQDETRAQQEAEIQFKIDGLERLRDFQNAISDIKGNLSDLVDSAVDAFVNTRLKNALSAIDNSAASLELKQIQLAQTARTQAAEDADISTRMLKARTKESKATDQLVKANADLARAQTSNSPRLIAAAQRRVQYAQAAVTIAQAGVADVQSDADALTENRRAALLEQQISDAKDAAQAQADAAKDGNDQEVNNFKASLDTQFDYLTQSLANRVLSYKQFADAVNAILAPLGLAFAGSADQEAAVAAPPPTMRAAVKMPTKKKPTKKHHAQGGEVSRRVGEFADINEVGKETAVLPPGTRIITAGETARSDSPTIGVLNINAVGAAARKPEALAAMIGIKVANARR